MISTSDSQIYTRVYAGNCATNDILVSLNISKEDIMKFLKKIIIGNSEQIRLSKDFICSEVDWKYEYKVIYRSENPFLISAIESIVYKNKLVFVHSFSISRGK